MEWFIPWLRQYKNEIHVIASQKTKSLELVDKYLVNSIISTDEIIRYIQEEKIEGIISKVNTNNEFQFIKDAVIKEYADKFSIPFFGQDFRSAIVSMDKVVQRLLFEAKGIPTPRGFIINNESDLLHACSMLEFPLVLKKRFGSANEGVFFADNIDELLTLYRKNQTDHMVIETFISGQEVGLQALVTEDGIQSMQSVYLGETSKVSHPHTRFRIAPGLSAKLIKSAEEILRKLIDLSEPRGIIQADCVFCPERQQFFVLEVNNRFNGLCDLVSFSSGLNVFKYAIQYSMGIKKIEMERKGIAIEVPLKSLVKGVEGLQTLKSYRRFGDITIITLASNSREELIKVTRNIPSKEKLFDQDEFEKKIREVGYGGWEYEEDIID